MTEEARLATAGGAGDEVSLALSTDKGEPIIVKRWRGRDQLMEGLRTASILQRELLAAIEACDD